MADFFEDPPEVFYAELAELECFSPTFFDSADQDSIFQPAPDALQDDSTDPAQDPDFTQRLLPQSSALERERGDVDNRLNDDPHNIHSAVPSDSGLATYLINAADMDIQAIETTEEPPMAEASETAPVGEEDTPQMRWWTEEQAKIFGMSVGWVRDSMNKKPSVEEARDNILRPFENIVLANGATISGLKKTSVAKIPPLEATFRMFHETQKILITGGPALRDGVYFLQPGRDWEVKAEPSCVGALRMLMVHPAWPGNNRKTVEQLRVSLENITDKPVCEVLWAMGFSVAPNIAPHTRKKKRKADAGNTWAPVKKEDRALLHQTRWQWNEKPFKTTDRDGTMVIEDGRVLLWDGAPLKKMWKDVRVVTRDRKRGKRAKTAE